MADNKTQDWSVGLRFVQHQKNSAHHSGIKRTPFKAMFGIDPRVGLASSSLPLEILERLQSDDDLLALFASPSEDEVLAQDPQPPPAPAAPAPTSQPTPAHDCPTPPASAAPASTSQPTSVQDPQTSQNRGRGPGRHKSPRLNRLLALSDVNQEDVVSLRQALKKSTTGGQGFARCDCAGSKKCCTSRCKCYKANLKCNSRYHSNTTCRNNHPMSQAARDNADRDAVAQGDTVQGMQPRVCNHGSEDWEPSTVIQNMKAEIRTSEIHTQAHPKYIKITDINKF
ncbi:uncharacterized protein LOC119586011 [Penaeus monodon]|uniref:uncharacterized protein LOC119586011 n=1 Tax=Penaeus monodon TaxID=6687 RepID=UPI0018A74049|nr:uncharacterized protein LOC119586011 [Penaeus monodon]